MDYDNVIRKAISSSGFVPSMADLVIHLYSEPHRHYHGLVHLAQLIERTQTRNIKLSSVQWLALFFHDAVSNMLRPKGENERQSVALLRAVGPAYFITQHDIERASKIILDTIEHVPTVEGSAIVLDLDMAGLAKPWDDFQEDSRLVFLEVEAAVTWDEYLVKRAKFFQGVLAHPKIFHSDEFQSEEEIARANLQRVVDTTPEVLYE